VSAAEYGVTPKHAIRRGEGQTTLLADLHEPPGRHADVLAVSSAQPPNRVAQVVSTAKHDQWRAVNVAGVVRFSASSRPSDQDPTMRLR
jgi:hypothetical protein